MTTQGLVDIAEDERLPADLIARMQGQPGFARAMRHSMEGTLRICRDDRAVFRIHKDSGHFVLGVLALYLHVSGGLTLTRLQTLCVEAGLCSAGRAVAILVQLRLMGFVTALPRQGDGWLRRYDPTPQMAAAMRSRMRTDLESAALVEPHAAACLARFDDDEIFFAFMRRFGKGLIDAAALRETEGPSLRMFSHHASGMLVLYSIAPSGAEDNDAFPPAGPVRISLAGLSNAHGISRAHVRRLVIRAEAVGYLRRTEAANQGYLEPALREELAAYFAILFIGLGISAKAALEEQDPARMSA